MTAAYKKPGLSIRDVAIMGVMLALIFAGKRALDLVPNVEIITLFFMVFTKNFGKKTLAVAVCFAMLEGLIFGFNLWFIMYLYVWPLLILAVLLMRNRLPLWGYCLLAGLFGLFFGLLCAIPYFFISGIGGGFGWWIAGIPFDLIHCASNFVLCLILFRPLDRICRKVSGTQLPGAKVPGDVAPSDNSSSDKVLRDESLRDKISRDLTIENEDKKAESEQ